MIRRAILRYLRQSHWELALLGAAGATSAQCRRNQTLVRRALHPALDVLIPAFETSSGHKVTVAYGTAGAVVDLSSKG